MKTAKPKFNVEVIAIIIPARRSVVDLSNCDVIVRLLAVIVVVVVREIK